MRGLINLGLTVFGIAVGLLVAAGVRLGLGNRRAEARPWRYPTQSIDTLPILTEQARAVLHAHGYSSVATLCAAAWHNEDIMRAWLEPMGVPYTALLQTLEEVAPEWARCCKPQDRDQGKLRFQDWGS